MTYPHSVHFLLHKACTACFKAAAIIKVSKTQNKNRKEGSYVQKAQQPTPIEIMGHRAGEQVRFLIGSGMEKSAAVTLLKNTQEEAPPLFAVNNRFFVAEFSAATKEDPVFDMVKKFHVVVEIKSMKYYALRDYFAKREEIPIIKVVKPHGLIPYWHQHKPLSPAPSLRYA